MRIEGDGVRGVRGGWGLDLVMGLAASLLALFLYLLVWMNNPDEMLWDDLQTQYLPVAIEVGRALRRGEWPLTTPLSWFGGALAGEYQYGVFSPVELACGWLVSGFPRAPTERVALLCGLHVVMLAAGTYVLARVRGFDRVTGVWVALAASLNGWMIGWAATNWYPAYTSFTWIPWAWAALERLRRPSASTGTIALAALPIALVMLAGWPFSVAMLVFIAVYVTLRGDAETSLREVALRVGLALALGAGLAAPAWMTLATHGTATLRATDPNRLGVIWLVPWSAWPGMVVPSWPTLWRTYTNWTLAPSASLFGGLVPIAGVLAGYRARGRAFVQGHRAEFLAVVALVALASLPTVRPLQISSRWLPLLHLMVAILGAEGLAQESAPEVKSEAGVRSLRGLIDRLKDPANRTTSALLLVAPMALLMVMPGMIPRRTPSLVGVLVVLALLWAIVGVVFDVMNLARRVAPVLVTFVALFSTLVNVPLRTAIPRWPLEPRVFNPAPLEPSRRYLLLYNRPDIFAYECCDLVGRGVFAGLNGDLMPGNYGMYAGITTINGYSPLRLRSLQRAFDFGIHGYTIRNSLMLLLGRHVGAGRMLDLMGVDGLVLPRRLAARFDAEASGWHVAATKPDAVVYHRTIARAPVSSLGAARVAETFDAAERLLESDPSAEPVFFAKGGRTGEVVSFGEARLAHVREERNRTTADVSVPGGRDALLVFARAWYPGFRATLDGRPLDVGTVDLVMPAVRVPAGASGRLVLAYSPTSVRVGVALSALSLCALVYASLRALRRR